MSIPLNPSLIMGAKPYNLNSTSPVLFNTCAQPTEGPKYINLQFTFQLGNPFLITGPYIWYVDLSQSQPAAKLSQASAIYIDASQSANNITILFEQNSYELNVPAGSVGLYPILFNNSLPKFYVINNSQSAKSAADSVFNDIINVFILNSFIPPFYIPASIDTKILCSVFKNDGGGTLFTATRYRITSLHISSASNLSAGNYTITLQSALTGQQIWFREWSPPQLDLWIMSDFNFIGQYDLGYLLTGPSPPGVSFNIYGEILIP